MKMTAKEFWQIIAQGHNGELDTDRISDELSKYELEEIVQFEILLRHFLRELDTERTIDSLKIITGMVTDDLYLYYRCWIISKGQLFFDKVLHDPDEIAEELDSRDLPSSEYLLYLSTLAYSAKTGLEENEKFPRTIAEKGGVSYNYQASLKNVTSDNLKLSFPKLWQYCRVAPPKDSVYEIYKNGGLYHVSQDEA